MKLIRSVPILLLFVFHALKTEAQFSLKIVVTQFPSKATDDFYVAGNFNGWNPKDEQYKMKPFGGGRKMLLLKDVEAGRYEFKITRGDWSKAETTAEGNDIPNRFFEVKEDATVEIKIAGWRDDYPVKPKPYTALPQVKIIDTAFFIPQLNRKRRIWMFFPKGYATSTKTYPVLYMHDGQNLFNEQTAAFGEWGIDECLDTLQKRIIKECIVVGIDCGEKRINEYNPYEEAKYGKGEGKEYTEFLVKTLKPFIDSKYRTKKDAANTFIAGSSMGGLISFYAAMQYPEIFGSAGIFSPSFWITPQIYKDAEAAKWKTQPRFYFYAGKKESEFMVTDMEKMVSLLQKKNPEYQIRKVVNPSGEHNEKAWRREFVDFYIWLMQ